MTQTHLLSEEEIQIAKSLVPVLKERGTEITTLFYRSLFRDHPELLNIFNHTNQRAGQQQEALAIAVYEAVAHIDKLESILPVVKHIAHKHTSLGVKPEQYAVVGTYLTQAAQEVLGNAMTPEILSIWTRAYNRIADAFIQVEETLYEQAKQQEGGWEGFRRFRVIDMQSEGDGMVAVSLRPEDGGALPSYEAGQYVCVKVHIDEYDHLRQYSLTEVAGKDYFRIGVKLEGDPHGQTGIVSSYITREVRPGDVLELSVPSGVFTLNRTTDQPVVLLGAGIGITPLLSMLYTLREHYPTRKVTLGYAVRDGRYHAFADEIEEIMGSSEQIQATVFYESPREEDKVRVRYQQAGRIDEEWLRNNVAQDAEIYTCGPRPFMQGVINSLLRQGIAMEQIHYEIFGPALSFSV